MYDPEVSEPLRIDERLVVLAGFLISAGMMACLAASLTWFGELIVAGWDGTYLIVLSFLVALESLYYHRLLRSQLFTDPVWVSYRVSEWVVILVVLKGVQILDAGSMGIYQEILSWQNNFAQNFFNNETAFGVITLLIVWVASGRFADELVALEANERVLRQEMETGIYEDRGAIRKRLANLILIIGGGMVVLTALQHTNLLANWFDQPLMRASVVNTIFYFILALVLLSLTNFNLVRASWFRDQIIVHKNIAGRWLLYSAVFILALALIARLLPTNYSIGLLTILNYILFAVLALLNFLVTLLILPVVLLFGWLMSFLSNQEGPETGAPLPPTMPESLVFSQNQPVPWVELIKSILFWAVFIGVVGVSLVYYFRENRGAWEKLRTIRIFAPIVHFLNWLGDWFQAVGRQLVSAVDVGLERLKARRLSLAQAPPWRFINPRRLSPRDRVRFYYLALVRRGSEIGYTRKPSQTPSEYSHKLSAAVKRGVPTRSHDVIEPGDLDEHTQVVGYVEDISLMTDKFIQARYSPHEVSEGDAGLVQRAWHHLRVALRRLRSRKERQL